MLPVRGRMVSHRGVSDMDEHDRIICKTIARLADTIQDLIGQIHDRALFEDLDEAFRAYFEMEGEY